MNSPYSEGDKVIFTHEPNAVHLDAGAPAPKGPIEATIRSVDPSDDTFPWCIGFDNLLDGLQFEDRWARHDEITPLPQSPPRSTAIILRSTNLARKIPLIKEVRAITGLGLKESKDLVESASTTTAATVIMSGLSPEVARTYVRQLEATGADVEIHMSDATDSAIKTAQSLAKGVADGSVTLRDIQRLSALLVDQMERDAALEETRRIMIAEPTGLCSACMFTVKFNSETGEWDHYNTSTKHRVPVSHAPMAIIPGRPADFDSDDHPLEDQQ